MTFSSTLHFFHRIHQRYQEKKKMTALDFVIFWRQFATLMMANIPIIQACDVLEKSQSKKSFQLLIQKIKHELLSGKNLFQILRHYKNDFSELTCQLIRMGEHTGKLDFILCTIADHQEKNLAFRKKIKQALFYPCLLSLFIFALTFFMFLFIIPRFAELFQQAHIQLPLLTLWIFLVATQLNQHGLMIIVFMSCVGITLYHYFPVLMQSPLRKIINRLPLIASHHKKIILAHFARHLAIALSAGIPIKEALRLSAHVDSSHPFTQTIHALHQQINSGFSLHRAMTHLPAFPDIMIQMIKIGEETGMLEKMLNKTADFFESEIDAFLNQLGLLLEPLIMIILGVLIGGLVISLYLPIFKLGSTL